MRASRRSALAAVTTGLVVAPAMLRAQPALSTIRMSAPPSEQTLPFAYAMRAGLFERAGIKIDLSRASSGAAVAAAIVGGAVDVGVTSMLAVVLGHARGIPFTIVAPSGLWLPDAEGGLLVASSSPLRSAKDFVGKTITAAAVNDINSLAMKAWMDQNGADSSTFKVVEIPQSAAVAALEAGRVDGITVTNPAFTLAIAGGKARFVANIISAISPRFLLGCWFTSIAWVERNRSVAERFARIIADAVAYVNGHVAETVDDLVALTGLDRSLVLRMRRTPQTPTVVAAEIQPVIDVAVRYKVLERGYSAAELVSDAAVK